MSAIKPQASMYSFIKINIDKFRDDSGIIDCVSFTNKLLLDQSLLVLPGKVFAMQNYFRVVFCPPVHVIEEIIRRLTIFCKKYGKNHTITSKL